MRSLKIAGLVAAFSVGTIVVVAVAQGLGGATFWPATTGGPVVTEWYSDVPWHQKLGTFAGNQIDQPIVLPYEALGPDVRKFCSDRIMSDEDCMVELGVNNVLGMYRTDTPYSPTDQKIQNADECKRGPPCIQVTLDLHSFSTRPVGTEIKLLPRTFGTEPQHGYRNSEYGGYVVTDGSIYAPQMPWYMAHYCDAKFVTIPPNPAPKDVQDPVCYGDYFSPMNSGFNVRKADEPSNQWPRSVPYSPYPMGPPPIPDNHCAAGGTKCTVALAGFDLTALSPTMGSLQYPKYNQYLLDWFNLALADFAADKNRLLNKHKFPWAGTQGAGTAKQVGWTDFIYPRASLNPFLGEFKYGQTADAADSKDCDIGLTGANHANCVQTAQQRGWYAYPRQCKLDDLAGGAPDAATVTKLRQCGLNYELHHNGFLEEWPREFWDQLIGKGMAANQYGRTSFLFAGVPGMQMSVSFYKTPEPDGLSDYERMHNASIFSLYLPMANVADNDPGNTFFGRHYQDTQWFHTLLMGNHMEADPEHFLDGIRGKVLWHNEYRTQQQYAELKSFNPDRWFAAAFRTGDATTPYHNNTCDGCHVRNGSGIPINTDNKLDKLLQQFMVADKDYNPYPVKDYTFTGQIRPMKLVFFDLRRDTARLDASRYSEPLSFSAEQIKQAPRTTPPDDFYYNNKIMNFYGDSFHVTKKPHETTPGYSYEWSYGEAHASRLVVNVPRINAELPKTYVPQQVDVKDFSTSSSCALVPKPPTGKPWPETCNDVNGAAILTAIEHRDVGYMLLNGKRLGNLSAIEAIPNQAIIGFQASQKAALGDRIAGEIIWNAGARDGIGREASKIRLLCKTNSLFDCFIGRFGWLGDRVSLEDQVANAAFVEMNMTSSEGYRKLYVKENEPFPIRYKVPNCGPANKTCVESKANKDLTERDIDRMADYARWVGNPTRSEFKVSMKEVIAGENIFRQSKCDTCHVIQKIKIVPDDTMLTANYRERLKKHVSDNNSPFLSYIGTDLLMHDMGYLSQVGIAPQSIRDADGVVLPEYKNYVQKVRTPALKGLRFNRFVTDAHKNTKTPTDPACDFLLHDGRACDAIEAAFLHDGPAVKKLGVIEGLNKLSPDQVMQLRAFLYSL